MLQVQLSMSSLLMPVVFAYKMLLGCIFRVFSPSRLPLSPFPGSRGWLWELGAERADVRHGDVRGHREHRHQ